MILTVLALDHYHWSSHHSWGGGILDIMWWDTSPWNSLGNMTTITATVISHQSSFLWQKYHSSSSIGIAHTKTTQDRMICCHNFLTGKFNTFRWLPNTTPKHTVVIRSQPSNDREQQSQSHTTTAYPQSVTLWLWEGIWLRLCSVELFSLIYRWIRGFLVGMSGDHQPVLWNQWQKANKSGLP